MTGKQTELWRRPVEPSDIVYTPEHISKQIINYLNPKGTCLDPCKGDGAFYNFLPTKNRQYCEVREGKDFFDFKNKVDWIIGNPPYSIFEDFLKHSFDIANNVSYLVPTNKIFQRQKIMDMINKYGGIKSILVYGSGQLIGFPFGFSVGNFHFQKQYKGSTKVIIGYNKILNQ